MGGPDVAKQAKVTRFLPVYVLGKQVLTATPSSRHFMVDNSQLRAGTHLWPSASLKPSTTKLTTQVFRGGASLRAISQVIG